MMVNNLDEVCQLNNEANTSNNFDDAKQKYERALDLAANFTREKAIISHNLSLLFLKNKRYKEAKEFIEKARQPYYLNVRQFRRISGLISFLMEDCKDALIQIELARGVGEGEPFNYSYYLLESELLRSEFQTLVNVSPEKKDKQKILLEDAIKKEPQKPQAYVHLGELFLAENKKDEAEEQFKLALKKDSNNVYALFNLGLLYHSQEDYVRAAECFQKICDVEKDNRSARWNLAVCRQLLGQFRSATSVFEELKERGYHQHGDLGERVNVLINEEKKRKVKFELFSKWVKENCEGADVSLYLQGHPEDVLKKVKQKFDEKEVPYYLQIAALGHDIERAFPDRIKKQEYGFDEEVDEVTDKGWENVFKVFKEVIQQYGINQIDWGSYFNKGRFKNSELKPIRDGLYDLYKQKHCKNSAKKIKVELIEEGWNEEDIQKAYELVLHHEDGFTFEEPHTQGDEKLVDYLINSDAASFLTVNLPTYLKVRGIEETDKKTIWSIDRLEKREIGLMEVTAIIEGSEFLIRTYSSLVSKEQDTARQEKLKERLRYWYCIQENYKGKHTSLKQLFGLEKTKVSITRDRLKLRYDLDMDQLPFKPINLPY